MRRSRSTNRSTCLKPTERFNRRTRKLLSVMVTESSWRDIGICKRCRNFQSPHRSRTHYDDRIPPQLVRRSARREGDGGSTCALTGRSDCTFLVAGNTTRWAEKGMGVFGKEPEQGKGRT